MRYSGLEQHEGRGKQSEGEHQGRSQADTHNPAKVDHRPDAAHHQRAEGHHGGDDHVETGDELAANHFLYQITLLCIRVSHMQLAVADDEVNGKGEDKDQQQGEKIG